MTRSRPAALLALLVLVTGCGGLAPSSSPTGGPSSLPTSSAEPAIVSPAPSTAGCSVSPPVLVDLPQALAGGHVSGVATTGELLVDTGSVPGVADTLTVWDRGSGRLSEVVHRTPPPSFDAATSQIGASAATGRWIVWEESGFEIEHADWTMWVADRTSGAIAKLGSFERGADGAAAAGWASRVSIEGDRAVWAAPVEVRPGAVESRIYLADLASASIRRIDHNADWPFLVKGEIRAVEAVSAEGGTTVARPVAIGLDGATLPAPAFAPAVVAAHAAGEAGSVLLSLDHAPTTQAPDVKAVATVIDSSGLATTNALASGWGEAGAGIGFLAWSDQATLWLATADGWAPRVMEEDPDGIALIAAGSTLWWVHGPENQGTLAAISCDPDSMPRP